MSGIGTPINTTEIKFTAKDGCGAIRFVKGQKLNFGLDLLHETNLVVETGTGEWLSLSVSSFYSIFKVIKKEA